MPSHGLRIALARVLRPTKMRESESESLRRTLNVVSNKEKASVSSRSPEFVAEGTVLSHSLSEAVSSQPEAQRASELSMGYSESVPKLARLTRDASDAGFRELCSVQPAEAVEADRCF